MSERRRNNPAINGYNPVALRQKYTELERKLGIFPDASSNHEPIWAELSQGTDFAHKRQTERFKAVKTTFKQSCLIALTIFLISASAAAQSGSEQRVDYRDGKLSVSFEQFPVDAAINLIQARTGLQIILPSNTKAQTVSLQLSQLPIEPALRLFVYAIGFRGFALLYDEKERPYRAMVIETRSEERSDLITARNNSESSSQPLTPEEKDRLQKQLELWNDLRSEARGRIEDRLKALPPSAERDDLVREYGRQILGIKK